MKLTNERRVGVNKRVNVNKRARGLIPPCRRNTRAELRVSLMLFVSALAFLMLTAPFSVCYLVHTLLLEWIEDLLNQSAFMTLFAIADLLAFVQHASQFYVCFACSFCFRQALRRQVVRLATRIGHILPFHNPVAPMMRVKLEGRFVPMRRLRLPQAHSFQRHILGQREQQFELRQMDSNFHLHSRHLRFSTRRQHPNKDLQLERRTNLMSHISSLCDQHMFQHVGPNLFMCHRCYSLRLQVAH